MHELGTLILRNTGWLYTRIYESPLFFLDLWSLVHLWSGFAVMTAARRLSPGRKWEILLALLASWEILELMFIYAAFGAFRPETFKDQFTDVLVGMLGGALCEAVSRWCLPFGQGHTQRVRTVAAVAVALTLSFLWVGSYGYRYNRELFNSPGLNWWAFVLWGLGAFALCRQYDRFGGRRAEASAALLMTWALYVPALLAVEYLGYAVLRIKEVGHGGGPLIFDLIHGAPPLWIAYVVAPLLSILGYRFTLRYFGWALQPAALPSARLNVAVAR